MKFIQLEYDQKLYKEKLEEHLETRKKITKFHTIYSSFGILAAAITPLLVVFVHTIISGVNLICKFLQRLIDSVGFYFIFKSRIPVHSFSLDGKECVLTYLLS